MTGNTATGSLILAADDDPDILALVAFRLGRDGHEVVTAVDGEEALTRATRQLPDLVILDIRMPKMTGLEVLRALRAEETTRAVPVILLTASVQDEAVQDGYDAGADDYIKKPFSPQELAGRVERLLTTGREAARAAS
jgi:CheY-like chemotaxis protein